MLLNEVIMKFEKSKIKAGEGKTEGKYPLYTCSPVVNKFLDDYLFEDEAIIIGTGGNPVINYYNGKFSVSTDCFTIKAKDLFLTKYLYFYLIGNINKIEKMFRGAGLKHLNKNELMDLQISYINKKEQINIIKKLDLVLELINIKQQQLKDLDELIKSQFVEMFGDIVNNSKKYICERLENISNIKNGGTPSRSNPKFFEGNIPWITTVSLGKNIINEQDAIEFITQEAVNKSATKIIPKGSLLFGIRVGVGKISMNEVDMCTNQDIVAIMNIDKRFRTLFLKKAIEEYSNYFNNQKRGACECQWGRTHWQFFIN